MTSLPPMPNERRAVVLDRDGLRDLDPRLTQHHRRGDVGAAQADGERAQAAVRAGVRVGAQHDLARLHEVAVELRVHDRHVGVVEVLDAALFGEVAREVGQLARARIVRQRDGVDGVIERRGRSACGS